MSPTGHRVVSARSLVTDVGLPDHEATRLLESASGRTRTSLIQDDKISADVAERFSDLAARRQSGEPLQYIEGSAQFGPIEVAVDSRVLIPRPETEQLWELVSFRLGDDPPQTIVDLGTGSGVLALALKHRFPKAEVHAVDVSASAIVVARRNIAESGDSIELYQGDLFEPLPSALRGRVDLLISNPPYIATSDHPELPSEVRDHEPPIALFGGDDGMNVLRRIVAQAPEWLSSGGLLACEIGADQGSAVAELAADLEPNIVKDLSGKDRFLIAQKGLQ